MTPAQLLGGALMLAAAGALASSTASVPQLYTQYALPGDASPHQPAPVIIDAPLTFSPDPAGRMHLGVALPLVGLLASGCSADAQGNLTCPKLSFTPPPTPAQTVLVSGEIPQPGATPGTWTLVHVPTDPSHGFCMVDGAVQPLTVAGNVITAAWSASASIACTYSYLP